MVKRVTITISGIVQGVGFRYNLQKMAKDLNLTGWAKNTPENTVVIEAQGNLENLQKFINWCYNGPDGARVKNLDFSYIKPKKEEKDFTIIH